MIDLSAIVVREHVTGSYSVKVWHGDRIVFERWQYASPESAFEQGHNALRAFRKTAETDITLDAQFCKTAETESDCWEAIAEQGDAS